MTFGARSSLATIAKRVGVALEKAGVRAVLTGGACASAYSGGRYASADIDFVLSGRVTQADLDRAMASVGFRREGDRYVHPGVPYFVEFPSGPLAIGAEHRIQPVELRVGRGRLWALSATDSCRDRLAAFYHWSDRQSLEVAVLIAVRNQVDMALIRRWSAGERHRARFDEFRNEVERRRRAGASR